MTENPRRILLVDDDDLFLDIATEAVKTLGHRVIAAESAEDALAHIGRGDIDLLLTDANLGPETDGFALARLARERRPDLPILYISGDSMISRLPNGAPPGPFISKPAPLDALARAIEDAFDPDAV